MPRPVSPSDRYMPGLDGIRALAVAVVVGYHLGVPWLQGGLLGVGVFFTLSGFLITSLLLESWDRTGGLELRTFWLRRARRLLPALVLVLAAVLGATALVDREALVQRWEEAVAGLFFYSNWHTIGSDVSYFERVGGPGPFDHLWSLAVEEQFYLIWPLLLLLLLRLTRGRFDRVGRITLALTAASFVALALLAQTGFDNTRAYEGTDTRAGGLLIGAAVAMWWRPGRLPRLTTLGRGALDLVGIASLAVIVLLVMSTTPYSMGLYYGGLLLLSVATAVLVAVVAHPASLLGRVLSVPPVRWVGERSYGIYLWHLPVVVFTPVALVRGSPALAAALQLAVIGLLAALSWSKVEDPIRRHGFLSAFGLRREPAGAHSRPRTSPVPRRTVLGGAVVSVLVATSVLTASAMAARIEPAQDSLAALVVEDAATTPEPTPAAEQVASRSADDVRNQPSPEPLTPPTATACTSVVHVGDSTSLGLTDPAVLADPGQRVDAQYRAAGAQDVQTDILGARSIVERYEGQPNAEEAVANRVGSGYDGCWVMAMGVNEVANQVVGGVVPYDERIDRVMRHVGDQPVLWTTARTVTNNGPWAQGGMPAWNEALARACERYPNLRVYDWAAEVPPEWFIPDGIHYSSGGYAERARRLAQALIEAFPSDRSPSASCLLRTDA